MSLATVPGVTTDNAPGQQASDTADADVMARPSKKARPAERKTSPTQQLIKAGAERQLVAVIKGVDVRRRLKGHVETCARMVDDDWHDGYDEQGEECMEWLRSCVKYIGVALHLVLKYHCGFELAHEVLKSVEDSWVQLNCIPFRCGAAAGWEDQPIYMYFDGSTECPTVEECRTAEEYEYEECVRATAAAAAKVADEAAAAAAAHVAVAAVCGRCLFPRPFPRP
eukprot:m.127265 g.127265  ORF g.127265 m.127265 type:complete len:225 (+) comp16701_c0_seq1:66-740(+)